MTDHISSYFSPEYPEVSGDGGLGGDDDDAALVEDDNCEVLVRDDDSIEVQWSNTTFEQIKYFAYAGVLCSTRKGYYISVC